MNRPRTVFLLCALSHGQFLVDQGLQILDPTRVLEELDELIHVTRERTPMSAATRQEAWGKISAASKLVPPLPQELLE